MVSLGDVIKAEVIEAPPAIFRIDGHRAWTITAYPGSGQTVEAATARCLKAAGQGLPEGYQVIDLTDLPR